MGRTQDLSGTPLSLLGCLIDGFKAYSTPRSAAPLQVYKRASSCAWTRQNTLHSTFDLLLCTWTGLMNFRFSFVLCWSVFQWEISSLSTLKQTNVSPHTHWLHERKKPNRFSDETLVFYTLPALYHQNGCSHVTINCCFTNYQLWWHPSQCLKSPLKRVFHVLRITFVDSHRAVFLRRFGPF